jgi:hypothetical protein
MAAKAHSSKENSSMPASQLFCRKSVSGLGWLVLACLGISGCAVKPDPQGAGPKAETQSGPAVNQNSSSDSLNPSVKSPADSCMGDKLFAVGDKGQFTLLEVLTMANKSAQQLVLQGDLEKAKERNRDIVLNRPALSFAVEDAQWSLALIDVLVEPGIPEPIKKKLRTLHEVYIQEAPQEDVVRQVNGLLAEVPDEKFRQHLKKLANRAWERDRRANRLPQGSKKVALQDTLQAPKAEVIAKDTMEVPTLAATPVVDAKPALPVSDSAQTMDTVGIGGKAAQIDSLIAAGKYVPALQALQSVDAQTQADFIKDRRTKAGERFCDDRRRTAAELYKKARSAANDGLKEKLLLSTQGELDSCLFYFPETSVGAKVRRNRDMVETELKKLKK